MTETEQNKALAHAVEALARTRQEKAEADADFKARIEALQTTISRLSHDILYGQRSLLSEAREPSEDEVTATLSREDETKTDKRKAKVKAAGGKDDA